MHGLGLWNIGRKKIKLYKFNNIYFKIDTFVLYFTGVWGAISQPLAIKFGALIELVHLIALFKFNLYLSLGSSLVSNQTWRSQYVAIV